MFKVTNNTAPDDIIKVFQKQEDTHIYHRRSATESKIFIPERNVRKAQGTYYLLVQKFGMKFPQTFKRHSQLTSLEES